MSFATDTPGVTLGQAQFPAGRMHEDENFGKQEIYVGSAVIPVPFSVSGARPSAFNLILKLQGCNEKRGICYPPQVWSTRIALAPAAAPSGASSLTLGKPLKPSSAIHGMTGDLLQVDQAFQLSADVTAPERIKLTWVIAEGYYLYRSKISVATQSSLIALGTPVLPAGETLTDESLGRQEVYRGVLDVEVPFSRGRAQGGKVDLSVSYQGCAEGRVCYPLETKTVTVDIPDASAVPVGPGGRTGQTRGRDRRAPRHGALLVLPRRSRAVTDSVRAPDDSDSVGHHRVARQGHHHRTRILTLGRVCARHGAHLRRGGRGIRARRQAGTGRVSADLGHRDICGALRIPVAADVRALRAANAVVHPDAGRECQQSAEGRNAGRHIRDGRIVIAHRHDLRCSATRRRADLHRSDRRRHCAAPSPSSRWVSAWACRSSSSARQLAGCCRSPAPGWSTSKHSSACCSWAWLSTCSIASCRRSSWCFGRSSLSRAATGSGRWGVRGSRRQCCGRGARPDADAVRRDPRRRRCCGPDRSAAASAGPRRERSEQEGTTRRRGIVL